MKNPKLVVPPRTVCCVYVFTANGVTYKTILHNEVVAKRIAEGHLRDAMAIPEKIVALRQDASLEETFNFESLTLAMGAHLPGDASQNAINLRARVLHHTDPGAEHPAWVAKLTEGAQIFLKRSSLWPGVQQQLEQLLAQ